MLAKDLRQMTVEELSNELNSLLKEQFNLRMQRGAGQSPRPHLFQQVRRDIARVKTVLAQMQGDQGQQQGDKA
jgi:large subunit ribosomal protein L29